MRMPLTTTLLSGLGALCAAFSRLPDVYGVDPVNRWARSYEGVWDLTRSDAAASPGLVRMTGQKPLAILDWRKTALLVIDMQNVYLHQHIAKHFDAGRALVPHTVDFVSTLRARGIKTLWSNYELDTWDLESMPPSVFTHHQPASNTLGTPMGHFGDLDMGSKLMSGSWNAQLYGRLESLREEGIAQGTDARFRKNRLSAFRQSDQSLVTYLHEQNITTILFAGVNTDVCVWASMLEGSFLGFDVILLEDLVATSSPASSSLTVIQNANILGFVTNTTNILRAL